MRHQSTQFFGRSSSKFDALVSQLFEAERNSQSPLDRQNVFEYVHSMAVELSAISLKSNNRFLSYLLNLAAQEALRAERTPRREIPAY